MAQIEQFFSLMKLPVLCRACVHTLEAFTACPPQHSAWDIWRGQTRPKQCQGVETADGSPGHDSSAVGASIVRTGPPPRWPRCGCTEMGDRSPGIQYVTVSNLSDHYTCRPLMSSW